MAVNYWGPTNYWSSLNKEEIKEELIQLINNPDNFNIILRNESGNRIRYSSNIEGFNLMTEYMPLSICFNEKMALENAKIIINNNFDEIAEWIAKKGYKLTLTMKFDKPIGYTKFKDDIIERDTLNIILKRSRDKENIYGFYICNIVPYTDYSVYKK